MAVTVEGYIYTFGEKSTRKFSKYDYPQAPGDFVESFAPGAFRTSLLLSPQVYLKDEQGQVIGSTESGELQLLEDNRGLFARAVVQASAAGYQFSGWSFQYAGARFEWRLVTREPVLCCREIKRARLLDVSLLTGRKPPYPGSTAHIVTM